MICRWSFGLLYFWFLSFNWLFGVPLSSVFFLVFCFLNQRSDWAYGAMIWDQLRMNQSFDELCVKASCEWETNSVSKINGNQLLWGHCELVFGMFYEAFLGVYIIPGLCYDKRQTNLSFVNFHKISRKSLGFLNLWILC